MSEQLFYLEDNILDVVDDYLEILNEEYKGIIDNKNITKQEIVKNIDITKHLKCDVTPGTPFFDIVSICEDDSNTIAIECHCCGRTIYSLSTVK